MSNPVDLNLIRDHFHNNQNQKMRIIHRSKPISVEFMAELLVQNGHIKDGDTENDVWGKVSEIVDGSGYTLICSILMDDKDKIWSYLWSGSVVIDKKEMTHYRMLANV